MFSFLQNTAQSWFVKIVFGFLIIVFVFWGIGAALFAPTQALVTVNGYTITQAQFLEQLRQEQQKILQQNPTVSAAVLEQLGLRQQVYRRMVLQRLLLEEAKKVGFFVTDNTLRKEIMQLPIFRNASGVFDQEAYLEAVKNNKGQMLLFENALRDDVLVRQLIQNVNGSVYIAPQFARNMYDFINEVRTVGYKIFPLAQYKHMITLTKQEIEDFYKKESERWKEPLRVDATYVILDTAKIAETVEIPQEDIDTAYTMNKDKYTDIAEQSAKEEIAHNLVLQETNKKVEMLIEQVQALILEGKTLQDVAPLLQSEIYSAKHVAVAELARTMDVSKEVVIARANDVQSVPEPVQQSNGRGYVFFAIDKRIPAGIAPLEEVYNDVKETLLEQEALVLAKKDAEALIASGQQALQGTATPFIRESSFSRDTIPIEFPVQGDDVIQAIFSAPVHTVLTTPYVTTDSVVVLQIKSVKRTTEQAWQKEKEQFIPKLTSIYASLMGDAFQAYLWSSATIELHAPELLQPQIEQ